jgi:DNA-binding MarR family transcriptional regulator
MRRRNTVLASLEVFRHRTPDLWVNNILMFFYVCENEGANIKELAQLARLAEPTASRSIRSFAAADTPGARSPCLGLVELVENPDDGRGRLVFLTPAGRELALRIDELIHETRPIFLPEARAAAPPEVLRRHQS